MKHISFFACVYLFAYFLLRLESWGKTKAEFRDAYIVLFHRSVVDRNDHRITEYKRESNYQIACKEILLTENTSLLYSKPEAFITDCANNISFEKGDFQC